MKQLTETEAIPKGISNDCRQLYHDYCTEICNCQCHVGARRQVKGGRGLNTKGGDKQ